MQNPSWKGQQSWNDCMENEKQVKRQTVIEYMKEIGVDTSMILFENEKVLPPTKVTEPIRKHK